MVNENGIRPTLNSMPNQAGNECGHLAQCAVKCNTQGFAGELRVVYNAAGKIEII